MNGGVGIRIAKWVVGSEALQRPRVESRCLYDGKELNQGNCLPPIRFFLGIINNNLATVLSG